MANFVTARAKREEIARRVQYCVFGVGGHGSKALENLILGKNENKTPVAVFFAGIDSGYNTGMLHQIYTSEDFFNHNQGYPIYRDRLETENPSAYVLPLGDYGNVYQEAWFAEILPGLIDPVTLETFTAAEIKRFTQLLKFKPNVIVKPADFDNLSSPRQAEILAQIQRQDSKNRQELIDKTIEFSQNPIAKIFLRNPSGFPDFVLKTIESGERLVNKNRIPGYALSEVYGSKMRNLAFCSNLIESTDVNEMLLHMQDAGLVPPEIYVQFINDKYLILSAEIFGERVFGEHVLDQAVAPYSIPSVKYFNFARNSTLITETQVGDINPEFVRFISNPKVTKIVCCGSWLNYLADLNLIAKKMRGVTIVLGNLFRSSNEPLADELISHFYLRNRLDLKLIYLASVTEAFSILDNDIDFRRIVEGYRKEGKSEIVISNIKKYLTQSAIKFNGFQPADWILEELYVSVKEGIKYDPVQIRILIEAFHQEINEILDEIRSENGYMESDQIMSELLGRKEIVLERSLCQYLDHLEANKREYGREFTSLVRKDLERKRREMLELPRQEIKLPLR